MREKSSIGSVKLFRLDIEKVMDELRDYAEKRVKEGAISIILIGSLARGDYTAFSDADVVILVRDDYVPKSPVERIKEFLDPNLSLELQPRVYTISEIMRIAPKSKLVREILKHGILLAGDQKILIELRKRAE